MTDMAFALIKHETLVTHCYPPAVTETITETKVMRTFEVTGDYVYSELVGFKRRWRRFLIERLEITWTRNTGEDFRRRWVTATGRTVLANGEISTRSRGYKSFWSGDQIPVDIAALAAENDGQICAQPV